MGRIRLFREARRICACKAPGLLQGAGLSPCLPVLACCDLVGRALPSPLLLPSTGSRAPGEVLPLWGHRDLTPHSPNHLEEARQQGCGDKGLAGPSLPDPSPSSLVSPAAGLLLLALPTPHELPQPWQSPPGCRGQQLAEVPAPGRQPEPPPQPPLSISGQRPQRSGKTNYMGISSQVFPQFYLL